MKSLQGRFKEFRRPYKPRKAVSSSTEHKAGSSMRHRSITSTMPIPSGEDNTSFERHNRALKIEKGKVCPNKQVIEMLMTQSFAMRWNDLHSNTYSLDTVFEKYPFLADVYEVSVTNQQLLVFFYGVCTIQYRSFETWKGLPTTTACCSVEKLHSRT